MTMTWNPGVATLVPLPDFLERGVENSVFCFWTSDGVNTVVDSGTCTVFDAQGVVVSTGAVETNNDGARYTFVPPATHPFGEGWRIAWSLYNEDKDQTQTFENEAMLVRKRIECPVNTFVLWLNSPGLNPSGPDPITSMTASEQSNMITLAWFKVQQRLLEYGKRPYLVVGPSSLFEVTMETALHHVFSALSHRLNENYMAVAEAHRLRAEEAWKRVRLSYDETQDGVVEGRKAAKPSGIWLGRGASRGGSGTFGGGGW